MYARRLAKWLALHFCASRWLGQLGVGVFSPELAKYGKTRSWDKLRIIFSVNRYSI